jgi:hypothetical protein
MLTLMLPVLADGLLDKINSSIAKGRTVAVGSARDTYFNDVVFPLLDEANEVGYSVEYNKLLDRYELKEVGVPWVHPVVYLKSYS